MKAYEPYPVAQPYIVGALYQALRRGIITRQTWAACMRFSIMGRHFWADPGRK